MDTITVILLNINFLLLGFGYGIIIRDRQYNKRRYKNDEVEKEYKYHNR